LQKHQAEERLIMKAAYRLMGQSGADSTSVQDILVESGLSTRAFYRHFESKEDLIAAMYREDSQRSTAELTAAVASAGTPARAVEAWLDHWLSMSYDPRKLKHVRVLSMTEEANSVVVRAAALENRRTSMTLLAQVLANGLHNGDFPKAEPDDDARALQSAALGLLEARLHKEPAPSLAVARDHMLSMMSRVLGAPIGVSGTN
jgi:AcrR family transcriptional regulator